MNKYAIYNHNVPENIRKIIKEKGLKKVTVAKQAGLTKQQFSDMITNRRIIKVSEVNQIANALGVTIEELFIS